MPNGLKNWSYKDLKRFLSKNGFVLDHQMKGSHEAWVGEIDGRDCVVNVNRTSKSYPVKTLEIMIEQSNISKKEWRRGA